MTGRRWRRDGEAADQTDVHPKRWHPKRWHPKRWAVSAGMMNWGSVDVARWGPQSRIEGWCGGSMRG
jgi:hypothetical protein